MAPKRAMVVKLPKKIVKDLKKFSEKKFSTEDYEAVKKCHEFLQAHADQAKSCLWALEGGAFSRE
eukprot:5034015-Lingulodinium_polyedra.AAC.1